jgi:hypothetical protein
MYELKGKRNPAPQNVIIINTNHQLSFTPNPPPPPACAFASKVAGLIAALSVPLLPSLSVEVDMSRACKAGECDNECDVSPTFPPLLINMAAARVLVLVLVLVQWWQRQESYRLKEEFTLKCNRMFLVEHIMKVGGGGGHNEKGNEQKAKGEHDQKDAFGPTMSRQHHTTGCIIIIPTHGRVLL